MECLFYLSLPPVLQYTAVNSTEHSPWEANSSSASQEVPHIVCNMKVNSTVHNRLLLAPVLGQINPVYTLPNYLLKKHFNIIFPSMARSPKWSLSLMFPLLCISLLPHMCHMPCLSHSIWLHHPHNTWCRVQIIKLFIMKFYLLSWSFFPLKLKYLTQHPIVECPWSVFFP